LKGSPDGYDLSDRPESRGEHISAACKKLQEAFDQRGAWEGPLADLKQTASRTSARSDVNQMWQLLTKKRNPDVDALRAEITRLISHVEELADHLHHLRR
jgi:hypothetical protein